MLIKLCILIIIIIIVILCITNGFNFYNTENYTPIIARPLPCLKKENKCEYPLVNSKKNNYKEINNDIYINQYGNRKILNPNNYLELLEQLLNDLSKKDINISNIPDNLLSEKDFLRDSSLVTKFLNEEINKLVNKESYLQNNGTWRYEYFVTSEPKIYYYDVDNTNKYFTDLPNYFNLIKLIYTLGNPLRSSYTSCIAFITIINGKFEIQYTTFLNKFESNNEDNLKTIQKDALNFSFIDTIANNEYNKYGYSINKSGLNYIEEPKDYNKINIKADIPQEFKELTFKPQYLPPLFGNGNVKYPPDN